MAVFDGGDPAHANAQYNANALGATWVNLKTSIVERHLCRRDGVQCKRIHLLDVVLLDVQGRLEVLYLPGDAYRQLSGVETSDGANAGAAGEQFFPVGNEVISQRRHQS
jgi:hypothetical protein